MYFGFRDITTAYGKKCVLDHLTLEIFQGEFLTVIGQNGCGKSSLMKTVSRAVAPRTGEVVLHNRPMSAYSRLEFARKVAYLAQTHTSPPDMDVRTLVSCGRYPYRRFGHGLSAEDAEIVDETLAVTGLHSLQDRALSSLSGGERQKAWIAMAVCRRPEILLLDEPTTHLDIRTQIEILDLLRRLNGDRGMTVVLVLHDLNLAARYSDRLAAIRDKKLYAIGTPLDVLTEENLQAVFGIRAEIREDPLSGRPHCIPLAPG